MTTTSRREAIHQRLDPIIEEIVAREISERGPYAQRQPVGGVQQQLFGALTPILLSALMRQQQQPTVGGQWQQQPFDVLTPILLSALIGQQQQPAIRGQRQQQPFGALIPILIAALSGS